MNAVGVLSYGIAAIAFLLLAILMMVSWRGRRQGAYLIAASAITAGWALLLTVQAATGISPMLPIYVAEILRDGAWLFALCSIAGTSAPRGLLLAARAIPFVAPLAVAVLAAFSRKGLDAIDPALALSRVGLASSLVGLILLEQMYRNAGDASRDSLKFLVCGVGGLFAYDLFLYSQVELLRGITADAWNARGVLNAFAVPLIAIAVRRQYPQWSLDVFVSRQAVFYTTTFMGVGAYLLLMAAGGYYVRQFGGSWGRLGQITFFSGALLMLGLLVGSTALRRRSRVFISKHFYRNKYDYRVEWLRFIGTLSSEQEGDVRRTAVAAIAQIFASPAGILFTLDEAEGRFVPAASWPLRLDALPQLDAMPMQAELSVFLARTQWIIDLQELRRTPDMYGNLTLPQWLAENPQVQIVSPLLQLDRLVGFVLLEAPPPPFELTYEDRDLLKTVGRHVATHLAQHEANRRLAEVSQFEAYNRLTAFLMHDLKNSVAQLSLLVANAGRHKRNPEFIDDAIETIANTVERITRVIEQLRGDSAPARQTEVDLSQIAQSAVAHCGGRQPVPVMARAQAAAVRADPDRLTAVIEHLIRNAQDASDSKGAITIDVHRDEASAVLTVTDNGSGMDAEFVRERLFRPFDSTKGSKGMGMGAYQVREYVRMLGGRVEVQSSPGKGTRFSISLPAVNPQASSRDAATNAERVLT
jgi:putative PEP-CTERM system histidine kinase